MGLRETLSDAAKTAFTAIGDIAETAYYHAASTTVYDASSGLASVSSDTYAVSIVFTQYQNNEVDNINILNSDVKALIPQDNLSVIPDVHDSVVRVEATVSVLYEIMSIGQDPAAAIWKFQLRKP